MKLRSAILAAGAGLVCYTVARTQSSPAVKQPAPDPISFRITFGYKRTGTLSSNGSVAVRAGRLRKLEPWRFFGQDRLTGADSWKLEIKRGTIENQPDRPVAVADGGVPPQNLVPAGLIITADSTATSAEFQTQQGTCSVPFAQLRYGRALACLNGDAIVERVPAPVTVAADEKEQHDYPSLAITRDGTVWTAWQSYLDRGDHVYAGRLGGTRERMTTDKADVYGTAIAEDRGGRIHVVWSERVGEDWHLHERVRANGAWSPRRPITDAHSPNMFHKLARSASGALWLLWVGYEGGESYLYASRLESSGWTAPMRVGGPGVWSPDAAADADGNLFVAWDGYNRGNYDVFFRRVPASGAPDPVEQVTSSPRFEAHPSVAVDREGRAWLAWDESGSNWGKDWNHEDQNRGTTLYADRSVRVAVRSGAKWMAAGNFAAAVPERLSRYAQLPRLAADASGRIWALFQIRTSAESTHDDVWSTGGLWDLYLTSYENGAWLPATFVPHSTCRPEAPFRIAGSHRGVWMSWPTDGRTFTGRSGNHELSTMVRYDVFSAHAEAAAPPGSVALSELAVGPVRAQALHQNEAADVSRIRAWRTSAGGVNYRIVRGDFHRHTEISYDGAGDGSLEDYYRYMLDGAAMDTGIIADHNMGGDAEYSWWRTEKSYDLFHIPGRFTPLFGYERSVRYPNGHRNVIFDHRGVRTLPVNDDENQGKLNSGPILFPYLRQNRGICMDHSMATGQGTDYRDNDPDLEPLVEIYQGYHASYEYAGAPRAESVSRKLAVHGPFQPAGFWWNALAKGLHLGVQASSDHISTHCSYAMVLTPGGSRAEIVDSMRRRHAYAATDNIVLDFQAEESNGTRHLMGDIVSAPASPRLITRIIGTAALTSVELIRNNEFVYAQHPRRREFEFEFRDTSPRPGENRYYLRVLQEDGNIAWSSPIWITVPGRPGASGESQ